MSTFQACRNAIAVAALCTVSASFAASMSQADYSAAKDRINADYKSEKSACKKLSGNEKDICKEKAEGKQKVAKAELEYNYSGKDSDAKRVAVVKADAAYAVAKEMCDDKSGKDKSLCKTEAKAEHKKSLADATMMKKVGDAKKDAAEDKRDADYKVAVEKCDGLAGDAKSACVNQAKARFNKS